MSKKNDPRLVIFISAAIVVIIGGIILGAVMSSPSDASSNGGGAKMVVESYRYNFGTISMADGLARHTFVIKNEGEGDLKISNISTSCMCTTVILDVDGERSPKFGMAGHGTNPAFWSTKIKPGQTANLEVTFDPLAHGPNAIGPITRSITLYSNDGGQSNVRSKFSFTGNVVK